MLPYIFGNINTYYVLWGAALILLYIWIARRSVRMYGMSREDASEVLWWVLFGTFVGASLGGYLDHLEMYLKDPTKLLRFWESPVSSGAGFICGGLAGVWKLRRLGLSVDKFAEASSIPLAFALAIGRLGCFSSGCCGGLPTNSRIGLRFPANPFLPLWPSQLLESVAALLIGAALIAVEKHRCRESAEGAILFPIFLITYGSYRFAFDFMREGSRAFGLQSGQYAGIIAVVVGICWLTKSIRRLREVKIP